MPSATHTRPRTLRAALPARNLFATARSVTVLGLAALLGVAGTAQAQEIPRDEYLRQLPLSLPRLGLQSDASVALHLYGDPNAPGYRDVYPVDGIDDRRHDILEALAVRFAPYLVQNTTDVPMNFDVFIRNRDVFPLTIDTWDVGGEDSRLAEIRAINFSVLGGAECDPTLRNNALDLYAEATQDPAIEDCKLLELMDRYTPGAGFVVTRDDALVRSHPSLFDVLYFNFPGEGAKTWPQAYEGEWERTPEERRASFVHAYVHPFIQEIEGAYELILQYWFFYPTNDSGMDHEGDWEHINVVVSPRSMVTGPLSAPTVGQVLDGTLSADDSARDPLVIKRVDYYFHEFVWPLDFSRPNVYAPRAEWQAELEGVPQVRFRQHDVLKKLRHMAYADDDETILNTHPLGYIGADNKGLNQALEAPGASNQEPHGTYPFPGRYNNIGPGGTTDHVARYVDIRKHLRDVRNGVAPEGPTFRNRQVIGLAEPNRLTIVPDWERVVGPARDDAGVRRDWAWLLLPLRWGYPATKSPFAGTLEHYNTGNVAPQGPSFNGGWNVTGPSSGFKLYEPHSLPSVFPVQVQDNFRNDLGFLNLTVPLLLNLPPLDFVARLVAYPFHAAIGRQDPVYYPRDGLPFRFVGLSTGVSASKQDENFDALSLNNQQREQFIGNLIAHLDDNGVTDTTAVTGNEEFMTNHVGFFWQVAFYVGNRFVSENTIRNIRSSFGFNIEFSDIPSYTYSADLNYWEYSGSLRYNILTRSVQPFVKGGYGWSWYRLQDVQSNGVPFDPANTDWFKPSLWPTVWHYGLGVEFIPWKRVGIDGGGIEAAIRLEYARFQQTLRLDFSDVPLGDLAILWDKLGDVPVDTRVSRNDFLIGVSITF